MDRKYLNTDFSKGYPAGDDISYECDVCGDTLPSKPMHSVACKCRNMIIDVDAGRVAVKDTSQVRVYVGQAKQGSV